MEKSEWVVPVSFRVRDTTDLKAAKRLVQRVIEQDFEGLDYTEAQKVVWSFASGAGRLAK